MQTDHGAQSPVISALMILCSVHQLQLDVALSSRITSDPLELLHFFIYSRKKKETLTILWTHNLCKVVASGFLLLGQNLRSSRAPGPCTVCSPASDHDGNTLKSQEAFK